MHSSMVKEHELTEFQKGDIVALAEQFSHEDIGTQLGIPQRTVSNFLQCFNKCHFIDNASRLDRLCKMSNSADCFLVQTALSNTHLFLAHQKKYHCYFCYLHNENFTT